MKTIIVPLEFKTNKGGVPQSAISLVSGLAKIGQYRLIVVCPKDSEMSNYHFPDEVIVISSKANDWGLSIRHFMSSILVSIDLYHKLKHYVDDDTLFLTNHVGASYMVTLMPFRKVKEIYVNRGGTFDSYGPISLLMKYKLKHNCFRIVIATSEIQRLLLIEKGVNKERAYVIHNGLPIPKQYYYYRPLDSSLLRISTMGFISRLKNQHIGVQLISLLRNRGVNAVLNLYGSSSSDADYDAYLTKVIADTGMEQYVYYKGFVKGEDLFSETDIIISFSNREGFGRSLVEGMLRKIPVIAYRGAGGPVDITKDGQYGHLVEDNIAEAYFDVIKSILDDPDSNKKNVDESYAYACKMFTAEVMISRYVDLLNKYYNHSLL